jgi:DNA polymerase-3 subunit alpha
VDAIVSAREGKDGEGGGPFRSLFDFCARVDKQKVNKRAVEALVKAGAFDSLCADPNLGRAAMLASVGLAMDWAETQTANALQVGLFDFGPEEAGGHGSSSQEPALVHVAPWDVREKLMQEKTAIGFYFSGHLFDAWRGEVRRIVRQEIADLADSREPRLLAGIVSDARTVPGRSGRVLIFKLDDGSESIETVVNEELIDANKELLQEDRLVFIQGKVQPDRFAGGLRLNASMIWDLPAARARFGKHLSVAINGGMPPVADVLRLWPAKRVEMDEGTVHQGLSIRLKLRRTDATAEMDLGDEARFWPSDEALARWRSLAEGGAAMIVYE